MKNFTLLIVCLTGLAFTINAQTIVNTGVGNKHSIIEEFTGITCPNCPAGHTSLENIINSNPGIVHVVSYNPVNSSYTSPSGNGGTDFRRAFANAFYTASYCSPTSGARFMPSAFINRKIWPNGDILQSRTLWSGYSASVLQEVSPLNVGLKSVYNAGNQTLTVDVEVYYTSTVTAGNSLFVLLSEDGLTSNYQAGSSASASNPYVYKHTFRENISTGQWGDAISGSKTQGSLFVTQYVFDLTTAINPINISNAHVIAFVVENNSNKEVYTGIEVEADGGIASTGVGSVGIEENDKSLSFTVFPNPSSGAVNINILNNEHNSTVDIINILGEVVYSLNMEKSGYKNLELSSEIFNSKGIYFVRVYNANTVKSQRIIIE